MKILKIADFYGSVQQRLSIDGRVFQVGVDVGGLEFHDDGAQAIVAAHYDSYILHEAINRFTHQN